MNKMKEFIVGIVPKFPATAHGGRVYSKDIFDREYKMFVRKLTRINRIKKIKGILN